MQAGVVLAPVEEDLAFRDSCLFREAPRYLMLSGLFREFFTGGRNVIHPRPYHPSRDMRAEVRERVLQGEQYTGKRVHFFTGLHTDCEEDLCLSVVNSTVNIKAHLSVDLFFEDADAVINNLTALVPPSCIKKLHLLNEEEMDPAATSYHPHSLKTKGLPPHREFAMRVISDIPVTVSVHGTQG